MRDENDKIRDGAAECMLELWQRMHKEGAEFFVDGEDVLPSDAVSRAVKEDGVYMADYVIGEKGKIKEVRLDKVYPE